MTDSPEHKFISQSLDHALGEFSETKLLGVQEAQRRTFDYGCLLLRDFTRPLISQVLWSHHEGIEKDIRSLVFDGSASLKLYFIRDTIKNRARIDEIIKSYREQSSTSSLLRGLRLIPVPEDFDADSERHQNWMTEFIRNCVSSDLLFAVVFGKLTASDLATFSDHGGPLGLKFATLHEITSHGLDHGPSFEKSVGSKGSPLREAITMLGGAGLIGRVSRANIRVPTLKGRFLLDLCRRMMFERLYLTDWSAEFRIIMRHLKIDLPEWATEINSDNAMKNVASGLLFSMLCCNSLFGRDLMEGIDSKNPQFHSEFAWRKFTGPKYFGLAGAFWNDDEDLDLFQE